MISVYSAELALDANAILGEGPSWESGKQRLLWVDIDAHNVHFFDPKERKDISQDVGQHVSAIAPHVSGGYILAVRDGFARLHQTGEFEVVRSLASPGMRMNDGKCSPDGSFWAGTMAFDKTPGSGRLYRLSTDGTVTTELSGLTVSNGLGWSPDGGLFYFVDSPTRRIDVFDVDRDSGSIRNRRLLVEMPPGIGNPDGLTIDHLGCLWVALWGGGTVARYRPDGKLDSLIRLPTSQVTSCCFGGPNSTDLFITTARKGGQRANADDSHAGGIFRAEVGISGPAAMPYKGTV